MDNKRIMAAMAAFVLLLSGCASDDTRSNVYVYTGVPEKQQTGEPATEAPEVDLLEGTQQASAEAALQGAVEQAVESDRSEQEGHSENAVLTEHAQENELLIEDEPTDSFYIDEYAAYKLTDEERAFTKHSIFVGDSICLGFAEYDVIGKSRVYARGNLGARSFWDYSFYYGEEEIGFDKVLEITQPKYVFFSMGMNDVNMTNEGEFCENYRSIIDYTLSVSQADIYIAAITPINSKFTSNYVINCFNIALEQFIEENYTERVRFVDFGKHLRGADGRLRESLSSGDGIHLAPYGYYIALWEMSRALNADMQG